MDRLTGIHAVKEALESGRALERIVIARGRHGDRMEEIVARARERGVPVRFEERSQLDRLAGGSQHQGIVALTSAKQAGSLEDILVASSRSDRPGILVLLDGVEDPHNLGAILRTALAAGAGAVVIPERRSASLTDVAAKAASGAAEHIPLVRVTNLNRALEDFK